MATLEFNVEALLIDLVKLRPELPEGVEVVHFDSDTRRGTRVIVKADTRELQTEGPEAYRVECTIDARLLEKDSAKLDAIFEAIEKALVEEPDDIPDTAEPFSYFNVVGDADNDRDANKNTRRRSRKFNVLAKEKP